MSVSLGEKRAARENTWIEVRLDRLRHNLKALKAAARPFAGVLAVIKANAYGHGLVETARALENEAAYLGVSNAADIHELKNAGIETPLFFFGRVFAEEIPDIARENVTFSLSSLEEAVSLSEFSLAAGRKITVHVKVDTGMGRMGIPFRQARDTVKKMAALPGLVLEGLYTHFPTADRDDGFMKRQLYDFASLVESLEKERITFQYRHAANSAGTFRARSPVLNLVRPGLALYGVYPDPSLGAEAGLRPVLSLKSRIIHTKTLEAGQSAGYGREFTAAGPVRVAVIPVGYGDGYPLQAWKKAVVLYKGRRFPLAGRISMDYITMNLGQIEARAGGEVTLIGEDGTEVLRAEDIAAWAGTIPYEILTRLNARIPRKFLS